MGSEKTGETYPTMGNDKSKALSERIDSVSVDDMNTIVESMQGIIDEGSDHIKDLELKIKSQDERISALLDSNNELSLELTQKNRTIQKLENEIVSLKTGPIPEVEEKPVACLIKKINAQKSSYENTFKGKLYLDESFQASIDYIESIDVPPEAEINDLVDLGKYS